MASKIWKYAVNFKPTEFSCDCGCDKKGVDDMDEYLIAIVQSTRNYINLKMRRSGEPERGVKITSGHRCQKYNDTLEGSIKNSDHVKKKAADFAVNGVTNSLAKRKEIMDFMRLLPGFKYAYCNGWFLYADGTTKIYNAPWMGTSIHVSVK